MGSEQILTSIKYFISGHFHGKSFEVMFVAAIGVGVFFVLYNVWFVFRRWHKKRKAARANSTPANFYGHSPVATPSKKRGPLSPFRYTHKKLAKFFSPFFHTTRAQYLLVSTVVFVFISTFVFNYFFVRPYVATTFPGDMPWLSFSRPMRIVFDKPFNPETIKFNIAPDLDGRIEVKPSPLNKFGFNFYRELEFSPNTTLPPEEDIVVYLVDIRNLTSTDGVHEQNLTFTSAESPDILATSIADNAKDIPASTSLMVTYDAPIPDTLELGYVFDPETAVNIEKVNAYTHLVTFPNKLKQSTTYKMKANRAVVSRDLQKSEVLETLNAETSQTFTFSTLKAPLVESIFPGPTGVIPSETIRIKFDLAMNQASVEENFKLEPETPGTFKWENPKLMVFTPDEPWTKDTAYKMTISGKAQAATNALLDVDLVHEFRTVGPVRLITHVPANGASNIPSMPTISLVFDQQVDQPSAQQQFSISPSVGGSFAWDKTTMHFTPGQRLAYNTTYTVKLAKGVKSIHGSDSIEDIQFSFRTTVGQVMLNVPQYYQEEGQTCNIAATRMVLAYRGIYRSEASIKSGIGIGQPLNGNTGGNPYVDWIDNYGTYWTTVTSYIGNYRSNAVRQNWNVADMLREVQKGNPVILWWQNGWSSWYWKTWTTPDGQSITGLNGMHSEVVVGFRGEPENPTAIYTNDPWRGRRTYSLSSFDNLWRNSFNRTAIVVY